MANNTPNLDLLKKDPIADGNDTFNITTMLNENWDKIDAKVEDIDTSIGDLTIDDTLVPVTDTGLSVKILLSWLGNMIKSITGKSSWRIKPTKNLEQLNTALTTHEAESTAHGINNKVDKVAGKQLSDTNYTIGEKMKLEGVEAGANKYVHPGSHPAAMITGLPTSLPASGGNADTIGGLAPSAFMNSINAGGSDVDPNTTAESFILTNHANSPGGGIYWHIITTFYASKTSESNKGQIAISYNGSVARLMCRHYFAPTWTPWVELMPVIGGAFTGLAYAQANTAYTTGQLRNIILSTADASGGAPNGAIWIKYKP